MKPSIKKTMTELNLEGVDAESLRFDTRTFLMDRNGHDNTKVASLDVPTIKQLARRFLNLSGQAYFPAARGKHSLVWGENNQELVKHITVIMLLQSRSKLKRLRKIHGVDGANIESASGSESEPETARGRLATVDRAYKPGGTGFGMRTTRAYRTRARIQGDVPIESIELESFGSGETIARRKKRRTTMSAADGVQSLPSSIHRPIGRARSQQVLVRNGQEPGLETFDSAETYQQLDRPCMIQPSPSAYPNTRPQRQICIAVPSMLRSSRSSSVVTVPNSSQDPRNKHAGHTPYSSSPTFDDVQFDQFTDSATNSRNTVETIVQPGITVPAARGWELTPPPSSALDEEDAIHDVLNRRRRLRHQTTIEPEDAKFLLNYDANETVEDEVEITGPETVVIHVGDDNFKVIERKSAVKILQKLMDFHTDSLSVYKRRAHQAPTEGQRRMYGLKADCLSKLLREACSDESIWQGGDINDPAVSML